MYVGTATEFSEENVASLNVFERLIADISTQPLEALMVTVTILYTITTILMFYLSMELRRPKLIFSTYRNNDGGRLFLKIENNGGSTAEITGIKHSVQVKEGHSVDNLLMNRLKEIEKCNTYVSVGEKKYVEIGDLNGCSFEGVKTLTFTINARSNTLRVIRRTKSYMYKITPDSEFIFAYPEDFSLLLEKIEELGDKLNRN